MNSRQRTKLGAVHLMGRHLRSGKGLAQTLELLSRYPVKETAKQAEKVRRSFEESGDLAQTMKRHPDVFPEELLLVADHAVDTAALGNALARYQLHQVKIERIFSTVRRSAWTGRAYLTFLLFLTINATMMVDLFVMPQFAEIYGGYSGLPTLTQYYLSTTEFLSGWWHMILMVLLAVFILYRTRVSNALNSGRTDKLNPFATRLPIVGGLLKHLVIAKGVALVNLLMEAGVKPGEAMETGQAYARAKGANLSAWLERRLGTRYEHLLAYYEEADLLKDEAADIADDAYEHIALRLLTRSRVIGLVSFLLVATIIGCTVTAIYLPIFSLGLMF